MMKQFGCELYTVVCKASKMKSWLYSLVFMNNIAALGFAMSLNYVFHHFETCSFLFFAIFKVSYVIETAVMAWGIFDWNDHCSLDTDLI